MSNMAGEYTRDEAPVKTMHISPIGIVWNKGDTLHVV